MKKLFVLLILFSSFLLMGFKHQRPFISMNVNPINNTNYRECYQSFSVRERIYYAIVSPKKGFRDTVLRVQFVKKADNTSYYGYTVTDSRNVNVYYGDKCYYDYILMQEKGYYIMRVFELHNLTTPIAQYDFWIR